MDDLKMVQELFEERPPPSAEVTAAARARLPLSRPTARRARLRFALPVAAVAAVAAAAVAVTAVVVSSGGRAPGQPTPGPAVYHLPSGALAQAGSAAAGRRILLTAAGTVAQGPSVTTPASERFWVARTLVGNFLAVGPAHHHYVILERSSNQDWAARVPATPSPSFVHLLPVEFASAADEAAWRREGSPSSWHVTEDTGLADPHGASDGFDFDITLPAGRLAEVGASWGGKQFTFGEKNLSAAQLLRLPADPARLKALLLAGYTNPTQEGVDADAYLFEVTPPLLTLPITPAVRSALYRMLAGLPGVRSLGQVQDAAGQYGQAVALDGRYRQCGSEAIRYRNGGVNSSVPVFGSCVVEQRLVINPQTGQPLAQELRYVKLPGGYKWPGPDGLFSFELFQRAYYTTASPPKAPAPR